MAAHGGGRREGPKTAEVIGYLQRFPEEIEADLARFYGRDVAQYWRGEMSARALCVLIEHLPEESATVKAQRGTPWTELLYLVAHIADTVTFQRADYINAHGGSARPEPLPRPDTAEAQESRDHARRVHDALTDMMRGQLTIDAGPTDTSNYVPAVETVR